MMASALLMVTLALVACGAGGANAPTTIAHPQETTTPSATATTDPNAPAPVATAGPTCHGGEWGSVIGSVGQGIPLPPQTVRGTADNLNAEDSGWDGVYISLCTGGTIDSITTFIDDHMTQLGWSYGPPTGGCECSADNVWSHANDPRLVQFESHPAEHNGQVRWGVICYRKGIFAC